MPQSDNPFRIDENDLAGEVWGDVPNWEGFYQATACGKVCSVERKVARPSVLFGIVYTSVPQKILTPRVGKDGYHRVKLSRRGKSCSQLLSRLVAMTFVPNPENKPEVNHKDANKANNRADNLEWATPGENTQHAESLGLRPRGEKNGNSRFTEEDVREIRRLRNEEKLPLLEIGKRYNARYGTIYLIANGKRWGHVA